MFAVLLITLAAIAAARYWALSPFSPLLYPTPSDWTEADLIRHIWHFRLVQPEWVGTPGEFLHWTFAETIARLAVVYIGWLASSLVAGRYFGKHKGASSGIPLERGFQN